MPLRETYCNQLNDPLLAANDIASFSTIQNLIRLTTNGAYAAQPCVIPANYLKQGTTIRWEAWGTFTNASTAPTLVFSLGYSAYPGAGAPTVLGATAAVAETSGASVIMPWHLYALTKIRNTANNAAIVTATHGYVLRGTSVSALATPDPIPAVTFATVNIDNSAAGELSVWATLSASASGNHVVLHDMVIEELTRL
jgi:hypothetical protein